MKTVIRDVDSRDLHAVLRLNEAAVPHVNSIDIEQMLWFSKNAIYFRVAKKENEILAFLVGLTAGTDYQSPNYRWFCDHYEDFLYVDRVAVSNAGRRRGLATRLYDDFARTCSENARVMTCEVNIKPANETSMQFHTRQGFRKVGSQTTEGGTKEVAMLMKKL